MATFKLSAPYEPAGDQPQAISSLVEGLHAGEAKQTLLGVTGSGKTFTIANVIAQMGKPTLVIAHNKTLAAQLAQEYREFFPHNAVHYFVSYYDYYQPEAYVPSTDTYIEKEAQINEEIDRLRHAATQALLTRSDVIVVASVSCIYNLGSPVEYEKEHVRFQVGMNMSREQIMHRLIDIHFERTNADLSPGMFRSLGNMVELMPVNERRVYRLTLSASTIERIIAIDPLSSAILQTPDSFFLFPAKHFITNGPAAQQAMASIKKELEVRLAELTAQGHLLEAERLKRRTNYDLSMIREIGYCNGIENYSRHFSMKAPGQPPDSLLAYFPHTPEGKPDFLTVIDESHVTISQIGGMQAGDAARKKTLIEHGFRLPSAIDNRPLTFQEFDARVGQVIFTTATPAAYEKTNSTRVVEQIIRPTGLIDPEVIVRPILADPVSSYGGQIQDFIEQAEKVIANGERVIATTLTKRMAEDLAQFLKDKDIRAEYMHSEIETLDRIRILTEFRQGKFDVIVGVNLLREGLDLPEVSFIGILDADKEGFLRSETSLIQIIGRAARNINGVVVLYADSITPSMRKAIDETNRRRGIQVAHNKKHGITPVSVKKAIHDITEGIQKDRQKLLVDAVKLDKALYGDDVEKIIALKREEMEAAVAELDFETAALLRDEILILSGEAPKRGATRASVPKARKGKRSTS